MLERTYKLLLIGFLCGQLISVGCIHTATIKKPVYGPFLADEPISDEALNSIRTEAPKDAVFADLLQAFALMRSGDLSKTETRKEILGLLMTSVSSFEDLTDPINFSLAFSADEDKAFRGRPHERMLAATMASVFLMADNNCAQAMPYLRNAEFLDARFQKLPFGTDAPLIYALMYRCLTTNNAAKDDIARAAEGVFRSVRFLTLQDPFIEALVEMSQAELRPMAIAHRIAYMIYEISIYHSLISAPDSFDADALAEDAAKNASIFISALGSHFSDEYKARMKPLFEELTKVYGLNKTEGLKHLEELSFQQVSIEASAIGKKLKSIFDKHPRFRKKMANAAFKTKDLSDRILRAASADRMVLSFTGRAPTLVREGSYQEISVIKPSPDGSTDPKIRMRELKRSNACGFHRTNNGGFSVVLCKDAHSVGGKIETMPSLELLSMSRKATNVQGRQFDKVLKGRAQFRAATEKIAEIGAWSAFFLFYMGAALMSDCQRRGESQACYTKGLAVWAAAGITAIFSGTVWLIGRTRNPSADSRFVHLMYESAWVAIK